MPSPAPIPRRLVYRILADALDGQVRHFAALPARSQVIRPGSAVADSKQIGRDGTIVRLREQSGSIRLWIGDPRRYRGPGVDAAVLGYLVALAYGHSDALPELVAELTDLGHGDLLRDLGARDLVEITARLCPDDTGVD